MSTAATVFIASYVPCAVPRPGPLKLRAVPGLRRPRYNGPPHHSVQIASTFTSHARFQEFTGAHLGTGAAQLAAAARRPATCQPVRGTAVASLLGVGAPEALVIAVVALLVFGPKGLAEVARNLGKTLKAFQPTIRELQQVSQDFRSTLEQEIGLEEFRTPPRPSPADFAPRPLPPPAGGEGEEKREGDEGGAAEEPKGYSAEDYAVFTDVQTKVLAEQRKASELAAWGGAPPASPASPFPSFLPPVPISSTTPSPASPPSPPSPSMPATLTSPAAPNATQSSAAAPKSDAKEASSPPSPPPAPASPPPPAPNSTSTSEASIKN